MNGPSVVLDACVLVPIRLATTLLWLAERGLFHPLWSEGILDEVERNLPKLGIEASKAAHRVDLMRDSFGNEALVGGFDHLIDQMTCDPKDRHVLAAAVHGEADTIATFNLKDFPDDSVDPHAIRVISPELLLVELLASRPREVISTLRDEVRAFSRPPETLDEFLATLTPTVPMFADLVSDAASDPHTVHAQARYLRRQEALVRVADRLSDVPEVPDEERQAVLEAVDDALDARGDE